MVKNINIVVAGLGTVGTATVKLLEKNKRIFLHIFGLRINIVGIFAKNKFKKRNFKRNKYKWFNNPIKMIEQKNVNTVIELICGESGMPKNICYHSLKRKKNIIKAIIEYNGPVHAPINKGEKLGKLNIYISGELTQQIDILSNENIKRANIFSRLFKSLNFLVWGDV